MLAKWGPCMNTTFKISSFSLHTMGMQKKDNALYPSHTRDEGKGTFRSSLHKPASPIYFSINKTHEESRGTRSGCFCGICSRWRHLCTAVWHGYNSCSIINVVTKQRATQRIKLYRTYLNNCPSFAQLGTTHLVVNWEQVSSSGLPVESTSSTKTNCVPRLTRYDWSRVAQLWQKYAFRYCKAQANEILWKWRNWRNGTTPGCTMLSGTTKGSTAPICSCPIRRSLWRHKEKIFHFVFNAFVKYSRHCTSCSHMHAVYTCHIP